MARARRTGPRKANDRVRRAAKLVDSTTLMTMDMVSPFHFVELLSGVVSG